MLDEERPHHSGGVDLTSRAPNPPLRQGPAPRPGMASTFNGIENHVRIPSAVRKRGPHLENVDTAAVEREGSGQLRRSIKTMDARRERDRAGTGAQSLAGQIGAAGLRD